ncbi:MAG: caspase family protein, partial [Candidatus Rokubacteria bacterium]|nr:caspase family protein [Candidatus Rokubacteria bacterium]
TAARERQVADDADAARLAEARLGEARRKDQEADDALAKQEAARAAALWMEAAEGYRQAAAEARAIAQQPLRVTLSSPADQAVMEQEALSVAGSVAAPRGIRMVLLTLNGVEIARREEPARPRSAPIATSVRLREGPNTIVVTAADADGTLTQEVRTVRYEPAVPLSVAVRFPDEGARVAHASSVVAAVATSSRGVERIRVTLNGRAVHEQAERRPQRSIVVAAPVTLEAGANTIEIVATETGGGERRERRVVVYEAPKAPAAAAAPAATPDAAPDRWAVIVGVGAYDHPGIPKLRYTVADAEALARTLIEVGGFKPSNVLLLTDRSDRKPTLRNLKWALGTFLARSARKADTVFIFFAGHGAPEIDVSGRERDGLAKYLVPMDADPDDLYATGLPMEEFETIFSRIEADRVVVFLDACYSGAAGGRTFASRKTRGALGLDSAFLDRIAKVRGRAIVTASRAAELSMELAELGHGLFTYYLVHGLRGAADLDQDGTVTLQELYQYVEREVTQRSRAVGGNQHPVLKGELEGQLPMVRVRR